MIELTKTFSPLFGPYFFYSVPWRHPLHNTDGFLCAKTDTKNLVDATSEFARWCLSFCEIDFYVVHRAAAKDVAADDLLRLRTTEEYWNTVDDALPAMLDLSPPNEDEILCIETSNVIAMMTMNLTPSLQNFLPCALLWPPNQRGTELHPC